jgi:ABC-2 type transport system ATP-binding protein
MAGLREHRRRLTAELSLGWKQRLALGCAVLHEPPVLFLDEPTSGVDPISRRSFWDLIDTMAGAGTTVLVSTHYMEEAEHCRRLALMNRGRLVALDTPRALRASVREPLLEIRVEAGARAVEALQSLPEIHEAGLFGRAVHARVRDAAAARTAIERRLSEAGVALLGIEEITPSLEDVFLAKISGEGAEGGKSGDA